MPPMKLSNLVVKTKHVSYNSYALLKFVLEFGAVPLNLF